MQRGIKQASDAYARVAASIGSLERVVELHDRGAFRDAAHTLGREKVPVRGRVLPLLYMSLIRPCLGPVQHKCSGFGLRPNGINAQYWA